jgi:hypothetical protein
MNRFAGTREPALRRLRQQLYTRCRIPLFRPISAILRGQFSADWNGGYRSPMPVLAGFGTQLCQQYRIRAAELADSD